MTNVMTKKPLRVSTDGSAGPYIRVPATQLQMVEKLLKHHAIRCWADENVISINGAPAMGVINLGRNGDSAKAQAVLDTAQ